jgi:hypothetical protein
MVTIPEVGHLHSRLNREVTAATMAASTVAIMLDPLLCLLSPHNLSMVLHHHYLLIRVDISLKVNLDMARQ